MVANILQKHEYLYFKAMKFGTLYIYEFYIHKDRGSTAPPPSQYRSQFLHWFVVY